MSKDNLQVWLEDEVMIHALNMEADLTSRDLASIVERLRQSRHFNDGLADVIRDSIMAERPGTEI